MGFRGDRLKKLRLEKKLTQENLSEMIGLTKPAICFYETGKRNPSIGNIIDFMQIFNVTADYLIGADTVIETFSNDDEEKKHVVMTEDEVKVIEELRKNKMIYDIIFEDPKRGIELIKNRIG